MSKQQVRSKPDFFTILVLLVILGLGLTLTIQLDFTVVDRMVEKQQVKSLASG